MKEIIIKTQKELEAIKLDYDGYVYIEGGTETNPLVLRINFTAATVIVRGQAWLDVRESATIRDVRDSATIGNVYGSATIGNVYGSATIGNVYGSATIGNVRDSATIGDVYGSATIGDVRDSATIGNVRDSATIGNVYGSATIGYVGGSATIRYVYGSATIRYVYDSATIRYVYDSATIRDVRDSATIGDVRDSATIRYVGGSATIGYVRESATIRYVRDSATIRYVGGSATIGYVGDSATIRYVYGSATIALHGEAVIANAHFAKKITCSGYNTVVVHKSDKKNLNLVMNKTSNLVILPDNILRTKPSFVAYKAYYPVEVKGTKAIMYKSVHKKGDKYVSDKNSSFEYVVGQKKTETCDPMSSGSCARGLHISDKGWALGFGAGWDDQALLECEVAIKDIVVSTDTDGKVRTSKLKVIREVPKSEWYK